MDRLLGERRLIPTFHSMNTFMLKSTTMFVVLDYLSCDCHIAVCRRGRKPLYSAPSVTPATGGGGVSHDSHVSPSPMTSPLTVSAFHHKADIEHLLLAAGLEVSVCVCVYVCGSVWVCAWHRLAGIQSHPAFYTTVVMGVSASIQMTVWIGNYIYFVSSCRIISVVPNMCVSQCVYNCFL